MNDQPAPPKRSVDVRARVAHRLMSVVAASASVIDVVRQKLGRRVRGSE